MSSESTPQIALAIVALGAIVTIGYLVIRYMNDGHLPFVPRNPCLEGSQHASISVISEKDALQRIGKDPTLCYNWSYQTEDAEKIGVPYWGGSWGCCNCGSKATQGTWCTDPIKDDAACDFYLNVEKGKKRAALHEGVCQCVREWCGDHCDVPAVDCSNPKYTNLKQGAKCAPNTDSNPAFGTCSACQCDDDYIWLDSTEGCIKKPFACLQPDAAIVHKNQYKNVVMAVDCADTEAQYWEKLSDTSRVQLHAGNPEEYPEGYFVGCRLSDADGNTYMTPPCMTGVQWSSEAEKYSCHCTGCTGHEGEDFLADPGEPITCCMDGGCGAPGNVRCDQAPPYPGDNSFNWCAAHTQDGTAARDGNCCDECSWDSGRWCKPRNE